MSKFVDDEGHFVAGFEQELPEEMRDYARSFSTLADALKSGLQSRREFRDRVKIPAEPEKRQAFLTEHFGPELAAQEKARQDAAAAEVKRQQEEAEKRNTERQAAARANVQKILGENPDVNLELARRAFRGEHCPPWIREGVARAVGTEKEKLTDEQIKEVLASDPVVISTLLTIGNLTRDGRTQTGAGPTEKAPDEQTPLQPACPHLYANLPEDHPVRKWFAHRNIEVRAL